MDGQMPKSPPEPRRNVEWKIRHIIPSAGRPGGLHSGNLENQKRREIECPRSEGGHEFARGSDKT